MLRSSAARGAAQVTAKLGDRMRTPLRAELEELGLCALANFPAGVGAAADCDGELCAGVLVPLGGTLAGVALLALDPQDALLFIAAANAEGDALSAYVELGSTLVAALTDELAEPLGASVDPGLGSLHEDSVVGILLGTHAPSDTGLLALRLTLHLGAAEDENALRLPAQVILLVDAKRFVGAR